MMQHPGLQCVLFDEQSIATRLDEMAAEITAFYQDKPLTVLAILNGSLVFAADLLRRIPIPLRFESLSVASYHGTTSSGTLTYRQSSFPEISGQHVLLLDDILDSGCTLHGVRQRLMAECEPLSVQVAVLLQKRKQRHDELYADYVGFEIDDEFVVGYGLDYEGHYRNLPVIGVLDPSLNGG